MKLFAPRNYGGWSMTDPNSWWPFVGTQPTVSGKRVSNDSALTFSAVFAATRVISEAIAGLPLSIKEQVDYRTTRDATDHPLWHIVHDVPNPEQDKMCWFDMQTAFLPNWGNCYAEKQFNLAGQIVALWPIHPSRIPLSNITRNDTDPGQVYKIVVGQPGEIVYWVKNDDNSLTPIPASDMLHVPGVLSSNGITGQSIIQWAANSIGIAQSTEESAGALFKNGALTNMVIKSPKIVNQETAKRLRDQWQTTFAGAMNHYKTLLLEEGMEPFPISMNPVDTQLILQRQFGISEIARFWKIPPHMLGDLSRSTFSNIEQQYLEFIVHSLGPWVTRWESALFRQLLTPAEQKRYRFKFNLNAMLRGDSAARSAFYKSLFDMGVVSPNDIRELEDWNPVEGGDQRFIPGNNLIPLDKASEMADAQIEKMKAPPPAPQQPTLPAEKQPPATDAIDAEFELQREFLRLQFGHLSESIGQKIEPLNAKLAAIPEAISQAAECDKLVADKTTELNREFLRLQFDNLPTKGEISDLKQKIDAIPENLPKVEPVQGPTLDEMTAAMSGAVAPLAASVEKTSAALVPIAEGVAGIPAAMLEAVATIEPPQAPDPPDTKILEAVAIREAQIATKQAEIDEKQQKEREITDKLLILSLKRAIDGLCIWESKALDKAIEKPAEWGDWRVKYYARFTKHFVNDLGEYLAGASACGITLDLEWGADRYAAASISDLKTLDEAAKDNFHDRLKECCDHFRKRQWTERSAVLAGELVERGRKIFNESKKKGESCPDN